MSVLKVLTYPEEVLRQKAAPVEAVDDEIKRLMDDMVETMYAYSGIGLAAPQVGVSKRVIVVDVGKMEDQPSNVFMLANPVIMKSSGEIEYEEGCLSVPEFTVNVKRFSNITLRALDREGREVELEAEGILAIALQHEMDHLEGTLILDKASSIKREFYKKRVKKALARQ